jgi:hypothetical protein
MKRIKAVSYFSLAAFVSVPEDSFNLFVLRLPLAVIFNLLLVFQMLRASAVHRRAAKKEAIITEMLGNVNEEYATPNRPTWLIPTCLKKSCLRRLRVSAGTDTSENQANIYVGSAVAVVWLRFDLMFFWSLL